MFPRNTISNLVHPCLPLARRLEHCANAAHFPQECEQISLDYFECLGRDKAVLRAHQLSKDVAVSGAYVPAYDVVSDRFEGMSVDETLRSARPAPPASAPH